MSKLPSLDFNTINLNVHSSSKQKLNKHPSSIISSVQNQNNHNNYDIHSDSENTLPNTPPKEISNNKKLQRNPIYTKTKSKQLSKHVSFEKTYLQIIEVESYKKYNLENTSEDPMDNINKTQTTGNNDTRNNKTHCKCNIY